MTERETLLAEIAERRARLAELDAPDPLLIEAREIAAKAFSAEKNDYHAQKVRAGEGDDYLPVEVALAALRRGMELAKAPPMGSGMTEVRVTEEQSASLHKAMMASFDDAAIAKIEGQQP